jgi:tetratricopeptide (TPR) repeat protein
VAARLLQIMANESDLPTNHEASETQELPFMKRFEQTITSYAEAAEAGNAEKAQRVAMEALIMAAEEATRNPTPSLLLKQEAADCETKGDWAGAEEAYRKVLALEESTGNFGLIAKAHMDLSKTLRMVGRLAEARQFAENATECARKAQCFPVLVMALEHLVSCAEEKGDTETAIAAASEMVQVIEPRRLYDSMRARALVHRARCRIAKNDLENASADLASSWEFLNSPSVSSKMIGPNGTRAGWWEVKSRVLESQGALKDAQEAMAEAIEIRRQMQCWSSARFALAGALERLGDLAKQSSDFVASEKAIAEARSIREDLRLPAATTDQSQV